MNIAICCRNIKFCFQSDSVEESVVRKDFTPYSDPRCQYDLDFDLFGDLEAECALEALPSRKKVYCRKNKLKTNCIVIQR